MDIASAFWDRTRRMTVTGACLAVILSTGAGEAQDRRSTVSVPESATALEGFPRVRIDISQDVATRRELSPMDAERNRLRVRITRGRFYWASRNDGPLAWSSSDGFTYLLSTQPGRYVRFTRVNDTLTYVEHVDTASGSVTFWGELRIVIGK